MTGLTDYFQHMSPSNINGFISWRSKWYLERIAQAKLPFGPEGHRGSAVEHGVTFGLIQGAPLADCHALALKDFDDLTKDLDVDDSAECRGPIPAMVTALIDALKPFGKVTSTQRRVERTYDAIPGLKWLGYADVIFEDKLCVDIKTKGRTPSELPSDWGRQGVFYRDCLQMPVKFVCAIPLKGGVKIVQFDLENHDGYRNEMIEATKAMDRLLSLPKESLADVFMPSPDDWFLKDPMAFNAAKEVWPMLALKAA